jgi:diguanylate cyclase (GGDEF)-like protein
VKQRRGLYAGLATSAGIVLGLLLLRTAFTSGYPLAAELLANRLTYIYVFVATALVFIVLGYVLGRQADELRRLSMTDALTGLSNRHAFQVRLRDEWRRSRRYHAPLALLLIDVDGLKRVNDEQGHEAGDRVLREVAGALRHTLRGTDIGARWGGDEFAIIIGALGVGFATSSTAPSAAAAMGAVMLCVAIAQLLRARRHFAQLSSRRDELERLLRRSD